MNDQKLIELLRTEKRDKVFLKLYHYFPVVEKMVLSKGGNAQDAQDIFQEGLIILHRKATENDFQLTSSLNTYLYGICQLLWRNEGRKRNNQQAVDLSDTLLPNEVESMEESIERESRFKMAEQALGQLADKCLEIIRLFYLKAMKMAEIAKILGYSSESTAKNQKYKCLEHARKNYQELLKA